MYQGTRWIILKQKKRSRKSHAWAPLKRQSYIFQLSVDIFDFEAMYCSLSSLREVVAFYSWLAQSCRNMLVIVRLYIAALLGFDFVVVSLLLFGKVTMILRASWRHNCLQAAFARISCWYFGLTRPGSRRMSVVASPWPQLQHAFILTSRPMHPVAETRGASRCSWFAKPNIVHTCSAEMVFYTSHIC
jgi:hypothetical protein